MAVLPEEIPTGLVTAQYYFVNEDNIDADTDPELTVVTGTVRFTASVKVLRMPSKKAVLVPLTFDAVFGTDGNLVPLRGNGIGIELPATNSPLLTEQDYTWKVDFNLKEAGSQATVNLESFDIQVPVGSTQDLSVLMPVDSSPGTITIQGGPEGPEGPVGPTPSITVGTVTTTTPNPVIGPIGPIGPKGDPGGFTTGTSLGTTDLNTNRTPGLYTQTGSVNATTASNYPKTGLTGVLEVIARDANVVVQRYSPIDGTWGVAPYYIRVSLSGSQWSGWRVFNPTRVDQTAGRAIYQWDDLNNREQIIYGDTGWRELSASLLNGWTASSLMVRRYGNLVTMKIFNLDSSAATNDTFFLPPSGWTRAHGAGVLLFPKTSSSVAYLTLASTGCTFTGRSGVYGTGGYTEVSWTTDGAWPNILPGTASGNITNL